MGLVIGLREFHVLNGTLLTALVRAYLLRTLGQIFPVTFIYLVADLVILLPFVFVLSRLFKGITKGSRFSKLGSDGLFEDIG